MQVRWDKNEIWLGKKPNGKRRATVPMTDTLRAELEVAYEGRETDRVIEFGGKSVDNPKKAFKRAVRKAGLKDFRFHDLRHTAAVWMCERGVPMEKISHYLGHSDIRVTMRVYAKYQPGHLADAAAALEM